MPSSSSSGSLSREIPKGASSSSVKRKKKDETKVPISECLNSIKTPRDFLSLQLMNVVQLPKFILLVNSLHTYGHGAFYFTYIFIVMFVTMPVLYLVIFLGQYTRQGSLLAWKMSPISYGVFMYHHIIVFMSTMYYGIFGSKIWWYMYKGISEYNRGFPWTNCGEERDNVKCYNSSSNIKLSHECKGVDLLYIVCPGNLTYQLPETQYFQQSFLGDYGWYEIRWHEVTCFAFYWLIVFLFLLKKSFSPKLALFTLCAYFALMIMIFLHVAFHFKVDTELLGKFVHVQADQLFNINTWYLAFVQTFLALMPNSPTPYAHSTCVRFMGKPAIHTIIITFVYLILELLAVSTTYAVTGIIARDMNVTENALQLGFPAGIILCTYPHVLNKLSLGKMWTAIYLVIAILSTTVNQVMIISGVIYSILTSYKLGLQGYWVILVGAYCGLSLLLSIPVTTRFGHILVFRVTQLVMRRGMVIGFALQAITVFWSYGITRLTDDIYFMCGAKPNYFWTTTWQLIPFVSILATVYSVVWYKGDFPQEELYTNYTLGINIALAVVTSIVVFRAGIKIVQYAKVHDLSSLFEPTFDWGPPNKLLRKARKRFYPDKYIPSQPLSAYNTHSTSWRLVKEEIKGTHFMSSSVLDHAERSSEDQKDKGKPTRRILFF